MSDQHEADAVSKVVEGGKSTDGGKPIEDGKSAAADKPIEDGKAVTDAVRGNIEKSGDATDTIREESIPENTHNEGGLGKAGLLLFILRH